MKRLLGNRQKSKMQSGIKHILLCSILCTAFLSASCTTNTVGGQGQDKTEPLATEVSTTVSGSEDSKEIVNDLVKSDTGKWVTEWGAKAEMPLGAQAMPLSDLQLKSPLQAGMVKDLALLGRVWGFAKYNHPVVRSGKVDWDRELIGLIPAYVACEDTTAREALLLQWLKALGPIEDQTTGLNGLFGGKSETALSPDFRWLDRDVKSDALREVLTSVKVVKRDIASAYMKISGVGGADFSSEAIYEETATDHFGMRLLTLFRIWNAYQYFSPYRELTDLDWDQVLEDHLETFVQAKNHKELQIAAMGLMSETGDGHVGYSGGLKGDADVFGNYLATLEVVWVEGQWVIKGPLSPADDESWREFKAAGLSVGDQLLAVNGVACDQLYQKQSELLSASTEASKRLDFARSVLLRSNASEITLSIKRGEKKINTTVDALGLEGMNYQWWYGNLRYPAYKALSNQAVYINCGQFTDQDITANRQEILDSQVVVLDLRGYPSGGSLFSLISLLINERTEGAVFASASVQVPGTFSWQKPTAFKPSGSGAFKGKLVALVDESSLSQPEYIAMYVKAMENGTVVGRPTAGADGNVSILPLPVDGKMAMTGLGCYYPDRTQTQRIGILPDISVPQTLKAVREGRDEIMAAAAKEFQCPDLLTLENQTNP